MICQIEIFVKNLKASSSFYEQVFAWKYSPCEIYKMMVVDVPDTLTYGISLVEVAGDFKKMSGIYIKVNNLDLCLEKCKIQGGIIIKDKQIVAGYGYKAAIGDLDGHGWGIFQAFSSSH